MTTLPILEGYADFNERLAELAKEVGEFGAEACGAATEAARAEGEGVPFGSTGVPGAGWSDGIGAPSGPSADKGNDPKHWDPKRKRKACSRAKRAVKTWERRLGDPEWDQSLVKSRLATFRNQVKRACG